MTRVSRTRWSTSPYACSQVGRRRVVSYPDFEAYRDGLRSFSGVIAATIEELTLSGTNGVMPSRPDSASLLSRLGLTLPSAVNKEIASAFVVSENYFAVLGVAPIRGRAFDGMHASELVASPSVLISENFWNRRFGADPQIVGKTIQLNDAAVTIIGITPADFTGTSIAVPNFWIPLGLSPVLHPDARRLRNREDPCCRVFGRLAPGVTMEEAQAEATVLSSRLRGLHDASSELSKPTSVIISRGSPLPGINASLKLTIALIMAAALMVLVIACANAAGLQLARATARQLELGMRLSLGASRFRLDPAVADRERPARRTGRRHGPARHLGDDACGGHRPLPDNSRPVHAHSRCHARRRRVRLRAGLIRVGRPAVRASARTREHSLRALRGDQEHGRFIRPRPIASRPDCGAGSRLAHADDCERPFGPQCDSGAHDEHRVRYRPSSRRDGPVLREQGTGRRRPRPLW